MAFFSECEETAWQESVLLRFLVSLLVLFSILYLGPVGIVLGIIICCVLKSAGKIPRRHSSKKLSFLLNSQLIVAVATYVLFIPIDYYIIHDDCIRFIAHIQEIKFPETKVFISEISNGTFYLEFYDWLKGRSFLANTLFAWQGALYGSFLVSIVWFSIILPSTFQFYPAIEGKAGYSATSCGVLLLFLGVMLVNIDFLYLSSRRVDYLSQLILPTAAFVLILFGTSIVGVCLSKSESSK